MPNCSDSLMRQLERQAEREMGAFLRAATEALGQSGLQNAAEAWVQALESLDWPAENHERFFRRVTILTLARLLEPRLFLRANTPCGTSPVQA